MRHWSAPVLLAVLAAAPVGSAASAQPQHDPDWPCVQRKVPELSAVSVWTGPPIEDELARWRDDAEIAALVQQVTARRMPLEDATAAVERFAKALPPEGKAERLTLLFAGIFQTLNRERSDVMVGIERFGRRQKDMAERLRAELARANDPAADPATMTELRNSVLWETRIFNERRASLTFVCEVPTIIEQRLFSLARAIGGALPS